MLRYDYKGTRLKSDSTEYRITFDYENDADLKEQIEDLLSEIDDAADRRNCVVEYSIHNEENGAPWDECDEIWRPDLACKG